MEQRSAVDLDKSRSRSGILFRLAAGFFILLAAASMAMAQVSGSAALRGTVKDETGAVVAQAAVTLTNRDTKYERKATTNDLGLFAFTAVDPGNYTLKVESKRSRRTKSRTSPSPPAATRVSAFSCPSEPPVRR